MRATVPLPARSTKNSFSTSAASSAPPQSHSQRRALRVATNITGNSGVEIPGGKDAATAAAESSFPTTTPEDAARQIIAYLVQQGAIGAVSTHDLALADDPRLEPLAHTVHFTDTVGDGPDAPPMSFDYRLRPGVATTTNALRLMRLIGLDLDDRLPGSAVAAARS